MVPGLDHAVGAVGSGHEEGTDGAQGCRPMLPGRREEPLGLESGTGGQCHMQFAGVGWEWVRAGRAGRGGGSAGCWSQVGIRHPVFCNRVALDVFVSF